MEINFITITKGDQDDFVTLHTDLYNEQWPMTGGTKFTAKVGAGRGHEFCQKHFPKALVVFGDFEQLLEDLK